MKDGEVAFPLLVDLKQVQGIVLSRTYVDLYFKQVVKEGDNEKVVFGGLFQRVRVTAAKIAMKMHLARRKKSQREQEGKQKPKVA